MLNTILSLSLPLASYPCIIQNPFYIFTPPRPTQDVSPVLSPQRLECPPGYMHYRRPSDEAANILRNYSSGNRCTHTHTHTHTMMACTCIILRPIQIYILSGYMQEPMRDKDLKERPTAVPCYRLLARNFQIWHTATIRDVALV